MVSAAEVTGTVEVQLTQDANDEIVATPELTLGYGTAGESAAFGSITFDGDELDGYTIGTTVNEVTVSMGDQGDLFMGGGLEVVGGETITDPTSADVSLTVTSGDFGVLVGLTDPSVDATDVSNLQLAATVAGVTATVDYNVDSEETSLAGAYSIGGATMIGSYADDTFGYEVQYTMNEVTVFANGDEDDALQNVGAGYRTTAAGLDFYVEAGYNLDSEEMTPAAGVVFKF